jgi:tetratricopeptide (TPR) repeat protein
LKSFQKALEHDAQNPELYLGVSRAQLGLQQYKQAIQTLQSKKEQLLERPEFYQIMASAHFEAGLAVKGWRFLQQGSKKFSESLPLFKQKWHYLMEHKLIEASFVVARKMLDHKQQSSLDVARMGMRYRELREYKKAITLGEAARLMDPKDEEVLKDLARSYLQSKQTLAAAQVLTDYAKHFNPEFLAQASDLWYQAGRPAYAKALILDIRDPQIKTKKALSLALKEGDYFYMTSLREDVMRSSLKSEEDILYALAYAHFQEGDFAHAKKTLLSIQRPDLFQKVVSLKEAIKSCQTGESLCWGD